MAKLILTVAVLAVLCGAALAKEKAEVKWSCKKSEGLSFKAKLAGAPTGSGTKQYPVGTYEICLVGGKQDGSKGIKVKQNVQGVNEYNGYVITPLITSLDDIFASDNATNGTNGTALTIVQCDPTTDYFKCKQAQTSVAGYLGIAITRADEEAAASTLSALAKSLCTPLATIPKGTPKTARSATIGILAKASAKPYTATYFTAPKSSKCT